MTGFVLGTLGVLFVALKLLEVTAVATWSWWLVLLPFWAPGVFFVVVAMFFGAFALFMGKRS